jgi:hypothetical protein
MGFAYFPLKRDADSCAHNLPAVGNIENPKSADDFIVQIYRK